MTGETVTGLTASEVEERVRLGMTNEVKSVVSRSLQDIIRANTFTLFNLILGIAFGLVLLTGRWPDAAFGFVVVINAGIGIGTEYRAKRVLDRLAILHAPTTVVVRDGEDHEVALAAVVKDDLVRLVSGDQIPADGRMLHSGGLEVDESLLTGESYPVQKEEDDEVFSGAFVVAGSGVYRVTQVGDQGYANRITAAAKRYSLVQSDLRDGVNKVLRLVSALIVPIALLLAWSQLHATGGWRNALVDGNWKQAIVSAVAGIVGMIPEGLVLLTSINFAVAAMILARRRVLVQELPAVEVLARVDMLCLDKTGTITDGTITLAGLVTLQQIPGDYEALAAIAMAEDANATAVAIRTGVSETVPAVVRSTVAFSSARKWSAVTTDDGVWVLGAAEVLLAGRTDAVAVQTNAEVADAASRGARVLLFARVNGTPPTAESQTLDGVDPVMLAVLSEKVRPDAAETLRYFRGQGVQSKIISGDSSDTVAAIGERVGIAGFNTSVRSFDARSLPTDADELRQCVLAHHVFGRVTPEQKVQIVQVLQGEGHVVAMTGDGVNDAPALKEADLGIAMGSGAGATKAVARIVLADGEFSQLPGVVGQGRRVMANMERVAALFLSKTTFAALLAVVVVIMAWPYPLLPRHMTLAGSLSIGIPAFILALAPNPRRYVPGFLRRVLAFAVPIGFITGVVVLFTFTFERSHDNVEDARGVVTLVFLAIGLWIVGIVARPLRHWKVALIIVLASAGAAVFLVPVLGELFLLSRPHLSIWVLVAIGLGWGAVECSARFFTPWLLRYRGVKSREQHTGEQVS